MAIYNEIIKTLGENLVEYNVGAWALFRDQMATEISSQYLFGNGRKDDESLLAYSLPRIKESNRVVKGQKKPEGDFPSVDFTYYTDEGPVSELSSGPTLPEPEYIGRDFKPNFEKEETQSRLQGTVLNETYDEKNKIRDALWPGCIDKATYGANVSNYTNGETLLSKTKRWFSNATNDYIAKRFTRITISRFHTDDSPVQTEELRNNIGLQAFSKKYGLSHGRNLLKKDYIGQNDNPFNYEDPYCRVWKWYKQYSRLVKDTMRPFQEDGKVISLDELGFKYNWDWFRSGQQGPFGSGGYRLQKHGAMYDNGGNTNGLVNITPSMDRDSFTYEDPRNVSVEHCMFSIENLAWKGTYGNWKDGTEVNGLSREQKGPLGGRIMWFPPYDIKFNETTQANWQTNDFIGRGEPIYTYANTTRSGSLSFKLLIDHPAILDYWKKRNEVGSVEDSGTDDVDSKEQELLRFFAGCEVLMAKPLLRETEEVLPGVEEEPGKKEDKEVEEEEPVVNEEKVIRFFVFYPNNYSGKSDGIGSVCDPINYLINGAATNKYHAQGNNADYGTNTIDLPADVTKKITVWGDTQQVGGYEMRPDIGVSIIKNVTHDNHIVDIDYGGEMMSLVKMIGNKAEKSPTGTTPSWNKRRYYYRVDNDQDVLNQVFAGTGEDGAISYIDQTSHQLNSVGYSNAISYFGVDNSDSVYSLTEVFVALTPGIEETGVIGTDLYDSGRVSLLKDIFKGAYGNIKRVVCKGRASSQGNNAKSSTNDKRNNRLSQERARTIQKWLRSKLSDNSIEFGEGTFTVDTNKEGEQNNSNDLYAKLNRFAFVEITYGGAETEYADETQVVIEDDGAIENDSVAVSDTSDAKPIEDNEEAVYAVADVADGSSVRYDNEAEFFQKLTENEPFMAKLLSERINNFDPVFHSMSPEGFNARLTFLNQCMRQGPTISGSESDNTNNLAFGRPPVCVLRVGDFYNTKIVITSMSIDYDPLVWDLNQEGIGVMPMIANISLQFNFIGGSDLGGPIQRIQNATSFNYYANASVYDNRAEEIEYENGKPKNFKAFQPR